VNKYTLYLPPFFGKSPILVKTAVNAVMNTLSQFSFICLDDTERVSTSVWVASSNFRSLSTQWHYTTSPVDRPL